MVTFPKQKLQQEGGASMLMALMLLLVCTTLASITVSAATAVSGRWSQIRDMDRSYYNVTSAARLVWDELERGKPLIRITRSVDIKNDGTIDNTSWSCNVDDEFQLGDELNATTANLFQILSTDLIFNNSKNNFSYKLSETDFGYISNTIDSAELKPLDVLFNDFTYDSFKINTSKVASLPPVKVTVSRNTNSRANEGIYDIVFIEESVNDRFRCTISAQVSITNSIPSDSASTIHEGGRHIVWNTTVGWVPVSICVGGA